MSPYLLPFIWTLTFESSCVWMVDKLELHLPLVRNERSLFDSRGDGRGGRGHEATRYLHFDLSVRPHVGLSLSALTAACDTLLSSSPPPAARGRLWRRTGGSASGSCADVRGVDQQRWQRQTAQPTAVLAPHLVTQNTGWHTTTVADEKRTSVSVLIRNNTHRLWWIFHLLLSLTVRFTLLIFHHLWTHFEKSLVFSAQNSELNLICLNLNFALKG